MHFFREGQEIRVKHNYALDGKLITSYGRTYVLSSEGVSISEGEPTLALPELIEGIYEVLILPEDILTLGLETETNYTLTFLGYSDEALTEILEPGNYVFSIIPQSVAVQTEVSPELTSLIARVRSRLGTDINALVTDGEIENFLTEALNRHDDSYWTFDEVPQKELPAIETLAAIECIQKYMSEFASSGTLEIMGLAGKVKEDINGIVTNLIKLSDNLQKKYDNDCIRLGIGQYKIQQSFRTKLNKETRSSQPRVLAVDPPRTKITGALDSGEVVLNWDKVYIPDFAKYEIYRDDVVLYSMLDALVTTYTDEDLPDTSPVVYFIRVYNKDGLFSTSNEVSIVVGD